MNTIKLGPSTGPWIEIIAPDLRAVTLTEAAEAVLSPAMQWQQWDDTLQNQWPHTGSPHMRGVLGATADLLIRFLYHPQVSPTQALYQVQKAIASPLPTSLAGAILAAASADDLAHSTPTIFAQVCAGQPPSTAPRMNRKQIHQTVTQFVDALVQNTPPLIPVGSVNTARFWLAVAREMWHPQTRHRIARSCPDPEHNPEILRAASLATTWIYLHPRNRIEINDTRVHIPATARINAWMQVMEWERCGISHEAVHFLINHTMPPMTEDPAFLPVAGKAAPNAPLPQPERTLTQGIITSLLREATEQAVYIPSGGFTLQFPAGYPLHSWQIAALRIWAEPEGLYVVPLTPDDTVVATCFGWRPGESLSSWVLTGEVHTLMEVTLAALWHDLVVAGEEVVPPLPAKKRASLASRAPAPRPAPSTIVTLPRRRLRLRGKRAWGTPAEQEIITRRAHGVRGHLRKLPEGWHTSEEAQTIATEFGLAIPDNYTFVRPHVRGEGAQTPTTIVRSRGLATVMSLLN